VASLPSSAVLPTGFDVAQLPAAAVLFLVLAIFSFASHGKGCILCWVVALVMVALGWFVVSLPAFGLALVYSVFILFIEGKQTEREI
jgi:accessory gene regulator protein AgrB